MATQTVTVEFPDPLYREFQGRAAQSGQTIEQELLAVVAESLNMPTPDLDDYAALGDSLALLNDDDLWRAAPSHLPKDAASELEALHLKQQREGLTAQEKETAAVLLRRYDRAMVIRAQALALLNMRGQPVDEYLRRAGTSLDLEEVTDEEAARLGAEGRRGA
jgi:hypothetical protein